MTTIHMETEKVLTVTRQLDTDGTEMLSSLTQVRSAASRLRFAWQGGSADSFSNELEQLIKNIEKHVAELQTLSVRTGREVDEWLSADGTGAQTYHDINIKQRMVPFIKGADDASAISSNDVSQGQIGDCFLIASLAAIAAGNPGIIEKMIKDNGDGTFTVTFYEKNLFGKFKPINVTVNNDDLTGSLGQSGMVRASPGDTANGEQENWTGIVESAYAKWKGGYDHINEGGIPATALEELTGHPSSTGIGLLQNFDALANNFEKGSAIALGSHHDFTLGKWDIPDFTDLTQNYTNNTLVTDHAYYVSGIDRVHQTITIRNPWGWNYQETVMPFDEFKKAFATVAVNSLK